MPPGSDIDAGESLEFNHELSLTTQLNTKIERAFFHGICGDFRTGSSHTKCSMDFIKIR